MKNARDDGPWEKVEKGSGCSLRSVFLGDGWVGMVGLGAGEALGGWVGWTGFDLGHGTVSASSDI